MYNTRRRMSKIESYFKKHVMCSRKFICNNYSTCLGSHSGQFFEGQLHHVGNSYDIELNDIPLRVVIVGQEYGHAPSLVDCNDRYDMIMASALHHRFKAKGGYKARNPHMRGTTNVLRLLFGIGLGTDYKSEFLSINARRVHIFDAFSLVNYLLCSAVSSSGSRRSKATDIMKNNCLVHFKRIIELLEPNVIIVQGELYWRFIKKAFANIKNTKINNVHKVKINHKKSSFVAVFSHPSAHWQKNWGINDKTPYLQNTVVPAIAFIRQQLKLE